MIKRRSAQVALQAVLWLVSEAERTPRRVGDIAAALGIPAPYLAQIVQRLTRVGVLRAVHGPGGGVELARSPQEMCPWDVVAALEPVDEYDRCLLGLGECNEEQPCPLHKFWAPTRSVILNHLQNKNLQEFVAEFPNQEVVRGSRSRDGQPPPRPPSRGRVTLVPYKGQ